MITIQQAREIDPSLNYLSDQELEEVLAELCALGELALQCWCEEKTGSNFSLGLLSKLKPRDTI